MIIILTYITSGLNKCSEVFNLFTYILLILQVQIIHNQTLLKKYFLITFGTQVQSVCLYITTILYTQPCHKLLS